MPPAPLRAGDPRSPGTRRGDGAPPAGAPVVALRPHTPGCSPPAPAAPAPPPPPTPRSPRGRRCGVRASPRVTRPLRPDIHARETAGAKRHTDPARPVPLRGRPARLRRPTRSRGRGVPGVALGGNMSPPARRAPWGRPCWGLTAVRRADARLPARGRPGRAGPAGLIPAPGASTSAGNGSVLGALRGRRGALRCWRRGGAAGRVRGRTRRARAGRRGRRTRERRAAPRGNAPGSLRPGTVCGTRFRGRTRFLETGPSGARRHARRG